MKIEIRDARIEDIVSLKNRLRRADAEEVLAAGFRSVEDSLAFSFSRSTARYTVGIDGVPVAMFGLVPETILGPTANVWFLGADDMKRIKKSFVKLSRRFIADFLRQYPILWNDVDVRYTDTIKWLESCGATFFEGSVFTGVGGEFKRFVIVRS